MKKLTITILFCSFLLLGATETISPTYTVQTGDTLSKIASKYIPYTTAYTKRELIANIKEINKISGSLSLGQTLTIPVAWKEPVKPKTITKTKNYDAKGLYMNPSSVGTRFVLDSASKLKKLGGNTLVFDAKDDCGGIAYPSPLRTKYSPNEQYTPNIEDLSKMIELLHRSGIHVVGRIVVFKDPIMSKVRPDWCINKEKQWLNPANPEVQEYLLAIIKELSTTGIDEIQLDYVRYFADGKTTSGKDGIQRTDVIAGFLKKVHEVTQPKGILLSIDMFGIVIWQKDADVLVVGQDVTKIKPYVDIISPMLYPSHFSAGFAGVKNPADDPYRFINCGVKRMKELVGNEVVIRPWLQAFPLKVTKGGFGPGYIKKQIIASNDAGGIGWLLWSPGNHYTDSYDAMQNIPKPKITNNDKDKVLKPNVLKQSLPQKSTLSAAQAARVNQVPLTKQVTTSNASAENSKSM